MNSRRNLFILVVVLAAALVILLALRNRQAPLLPGDAEHAEASIPAGCESCHGPDEGAPKGPNHPVGHECMRCHSR